MVARSGRTSVRWVIAGICFLAAVAVVGQYGRIIHEPVPEIPGDLQTELTTYLATYGKEPTNYVADKFSQTDIVFLGETHRLRHDVEFVQQMLPVLYQRGITNLAVEFGSADLQATADSVVVANTYDEEAVRSLMFRQKVYWGYVEYMELYRAAWAVNSARHPNEKAFRIVHLGYSPDFALLRKNMTSEERGRVFHKGDPDQHMAAVLEREVLAAGEKALVYCGRNHSFTRYHHPVVNRETDQVDYLYDRRLGNLIYDKLGDRAVTVLLHADWDSGYPVGGAIDRVCLAVGNRPVGFDTEGTVFGDLRDSATRYSRGYPGFDLGTICDGYVFLKPFVAFEGCRVDRKFVSDDNVKAAVARLPNPSIRPFIRNKWLFDRILEWDANPKHYCRNLTG
jgi:hypothetical protein